MFRCRHHCDAEFVSQLDAIEHQLIVNYHQGVKIMADIDQLTADFAQYKSDVDAKFQELLDELASTGTGVPPSVQAKLDALDASIQAADAVVSSVGEPTPPADGTGDASTPIA